MTTETPVRTETAPVTPVPMFLIIPGAMALIGAAANREEADAAG